jgi:hypothetical protein
VFLTRSFLTIVLVVKFLTSGSQCEDRFIPAGASRIDITPDYPIRLSGYLGTSGVFDTAVAAFAEAYADQNERDYKALTDAIASGRIEAKTGL